MAFLCLNRVTLTAILCSIAVGVCAETTAPVYDADIATSQQFDGQAEGVVVARPRPTYEPLTLEQRLARTEQQVNNIQHSESGLKLNDMQNEVQALRGQVEDLTHQLQILQSQQKTMYADLDKRLNRLSTVEKSPSPAATDTDDAPVKPVLKPLSDAKSTPAVAKPQPNPAEEQKTYQVAYDLIKEKKYNEAVVALKKMLQKYPTGQFAANAHYWLGELYGLMGKNEESVTEFNVVVKDYPESQKVSDAQLKVGLIYAAQFKWPDAKGAFKKVVAHYPGTASARLAAEQLKQLKQAGH